MYIHKQALYGLNALGLVDLPIRTLACWTLQQKLSTCHGSQLRRWFRYAIVDTHASAASKTACISPTSLTGVHLCTMSVVLSS